VLLSLIGSNLYGCPELFVAALIDGRIVQNGFQVQKYVSNQKFANPLKDCNLSDIRKQALLKNYENTFA